MFLKWFSTNSTARIITKNIEYINLRKKSEIVCESQVVQNNMILVRLTPGRLLNIETHFRIEGKQLL